MRNPSIRESLAMSNVDIPSVASKLYELLEPIEPPMRKRVIKAALAMLGDDEFDMESENRSAKRTVETNADAEGSDFPPKVQSWMKHHSVTGDQLQHVFHIENGKFDLIAGDVPGKTGK